MIDRSPGQAQLFTDLPILQLQEPPVSYKSGHFRIIHKEHAELLHGCPLRQQLRHDHLPLLVLSYFRQQVERVKTVAW